MPNYKKDSSVDKYLPPLLGESIYKPKEPIYHGTPPTQWASPGATEIGPAWLGKTHN